MAHRVGARPAWVFAAAGIVLALPLALTGAYGAAMRRQRMLQVLDHGGWVRRWLSGPALRVALALVIGLCLALLLLVRLIGQGLAEWAAVAGAALAVPLCAALWDRLAGGQIAPEYRLLARVTGGRILGATLALALYLALRGAPAPMPEGPFRSAMVEQAVLIAWQWRLLEDFALGQNHPNPFNSNTVIRYSIPQRATVSLEVYNLPGQEVARLVYGLREAGSYTVEWDGRANANRALATGVYMYRLQAGEHVTTRKLMLLR